MYHSVHPCQTNWLTDYLIVSIPHLHISRSQIMQLLQYQKRETTTGMRNGANYISLLPLIMHNALFLLNNLVNTFYDSKYTLHLTVVCQVGVSWVLLSPLCGFKSIQYHACVRVRLWLLKRVVPGVRFQPRATLVKSIPLTSGFLAKQDFHSVAGCLNFITEH
jgi:hypothetical protein